MTFWLSGTGAEITGKAEDAFTGDFTIIPEGTLARALLKSIQYTEGDKFGGEPRYDLVWKLTDGDFKNREVSQKIKPFAANPKSVDRALNMFKRLFDLCQFKPEGNEAPTTESLKPLIGKLLGIKIREYCMPKHDGSGFAEGNFVSEIHPLDDKWFTTTGVKMVHTPTVTNGVESALTRNANKPADVLDSDIPF